MRHLWTLVLSLLVLVGCSTAKPTIPIPTVPPPPTQPASCGSWPQAEPGEGKVLVWFHCGEEPRAVVRTVPAGAEPMQAAYAELVKGPSAEELKAGFGSWFNAETASSLRSVTLKDGLLVVDLTDVRPLMSGASSSNGSRMLIAELGRTGAQFPAVQRMEFQLVGSCDLFGEWIQTGCGVFPSTQFK